MPTTMAMTSSAGRLQWTWLALSWLLSALGCARSGLYTVSLRDPADERGSTQTYTDLDGGDGTSCSGADCMTETWFALGNSAISPRSQRLTTAAVSGGISNTTGPSEVPVILLGGPAATTVAWLEGDSLNRAVFVRRFDGTGWQEVGGTSASGTGVSISDNVRSLTGATQIGAGIFLAWSTSETSESLQVRHFDGNTWADVGYSEGVGWLVSEVASASVPSLALGSMGAPWLAWHGWAFDNFEIYVKQYDGNGWVEAGVGSAAGVGISATADGWSEQASLKIDGEGRAVAVWADNTLGSTGALYAKRFDGASWQPLGLIAASGIGLGYGGTVLRTALAIAASGQVYVAWNEIGTGTEVGLFVKVFDGAEWAAVGAGAINLPDDQVSSPALVLGGNSEPIVTWSSNLSEVFVRRYLDGTWVEWGTNSASGGGVSNSEGASLSPSLATDGTMVCVAWSEQGDVGSEVLVRCANL